MNRGRREMMEDANQKGRKQRRVGRKGDRQKKK
jgi:hypothetical protein